MSKPRYRVRRAPDGAYEYAEVSARRYAPYHYEGADPTMGGKILNWMPVPASPDREVLGNRGAVQERSRDLVRNNEWVQGGLDRKLDTVVGSNIRLAHKPLWQFLVTVSGDAAASQWKEWAEDFARQCEGHFFLWGGDAGRWCDHQRHYNWGGLVRYAYEQHERDGELFAIIRYVDERDRGPGQKYGTTVHIVDTNRVSNPDNRANGWQVYKGRTVNLAGGVELDANGREVGFYVRTRYEFDQSPYQTTDEWVFVPRETPWGRPVGVHIYPKHREDQRRGISRLASALRRMKMLERYDDAELQSAILAAVMALYAKSDRPTADVQRSLAPGSNEDVDPAVAAEEARLAFYSKHPLNAAGVRVAVLPSGDELKMETSRREHKGYVDYQSAILRAIASSLGVSYEQLSLDFSRTTYSSARAAMGELWKTIVSERTLFTTAFCSVVFGCVIEEVIDDGRVALPAELPEFDDARAAYVNCEWIGPPQTVVDPNKQAQADEANFANGFETYESICASRGVDWREQIDQRAEEQKYAASRGITLGLPPKPSPGEQPDGEEAPADQREMEDA